MDAATVETMIRAHCRHLRLPSVGARCMTLEAEAVRGKLTHSEYLSALLEQELEDRAHRRAERRVLEARFPQVKRLSDFRFEDAPTISPTKVSQLANGDYIDRAENVLFVGVIRAPARRCSRPRWASPPANRDGRCASPPSPPWSTNSSKLAVNTASPRS